MRFKEIIREQVDAVEQVDGAVAGGSGNDVGIYIWNEWSPVETGTATVAEIIISKFKKNL
jgi:hypothetical protein